MNEVELADALAELLEKGAEGAVLSAEFVADIGLEQFSETSSVRSGVLVDTTGPKRGAGRIRQPYQVTTDLYSRFFFSARENGDDAAQVEVRLSREEPGARFVREARVLRLGERESIVESIRPRIQRLRLLLRAINGASDWTTLAFNEDPLQLRPLQISVVSGGRRYGTEPTSEIMRALQELRNEFLLRGQYLRQATLRFHAAEDDDDILGSKQALISTGFVEGRVPVPLSEQPLAEHDDEI